MQLGGRLATLRLVSTGLSELDPEFQIFPPLLSLNNKLICAFRSASNSTSMCHPFSFRVSHKCFSRSREKPDFDYRSKQVLSLALSLPQ